MMSILVWHGTGLGVAELRSILTGEFCWKYFLQAQGQRGHGTAWRCGASETLKTVYWYIIFRKVEKQGNDGRDLTLYAE